MHTEDFRRESATLYNLKGRPHHRQSLYHKDEDV